MEVYQRRRVCRNLVLMKLLVNRVLEVREKVTHRARAARAGVAGAGAAVARAVDTQSQFEAQEWTTSEFSLCRSRVRSDVGLLSRRWRTGRL